MTNTTLHLPKQPERAVPRQPENTARALTPAEAEARRRLAAIAEAEAKAKDELARRKP